MNNVKHVIMVHGQKAEMQQCYCGWYIQLPPSFNWLTKDNKP
jgi:hypothetical protein